MLSFLSSLRRLAGRSPYGERGLKYRDLSIARAFGESLSLRRAWIEITADTPRSTRHDVALLTESVD